MCLFLTARNYTSTFVGLFFLTHGWPSRVVDLIRGIHCSKHVKEEEEEEEEEEEDEKCVCVYSR